jgi:NAD(P)H-dependent FMN reductase
MLSGSLFVPILIGSVRRGRQSPKVARLVRERLAQHPRVETELLDLAEVDLPVMEERLRLRDDPPPGLAQLAAALERADGLVIVTPEYNNGIPGALKNALDYLLPEFRRMPVGIATVSAGGFGGISCLAQLRLVLLAMGAVPVPASLPVSRVQAAFDDDGHPTDAKLADRTDRLLDELLWWSRAASRQRHTDPPSSA